MKSKMAPTLLTDELLTEILDEIDRCIDRDIIKMEIGIDVIQLELSNPLESKTCLVFSLVRDCTTHIQEVSKLLFESVLAHPTLGLDPVTASFCENPKQF